MLIYTKEIYQHLYRLNVDDQWIGYSRELYEHIGWDSLKRRDNQIRSLFVGSGRKVLIVGSGFGFLAERLLDRGMDVWCVEGSPFIQSHARYMRDDVRERTVYGYAGIDDVASQLRNRSRSYRFHWVIDEDAASAHDDEELPAFYSALEQLVQGPPSRIVHVTSVGEWSPDKFPLLNWKTLEQWKATAPSHSWFEA